MVNDQKGGLAWFRLITPMLITLLGTSSLSTLQDIKNQLEKINNKFESHIERHQTLEIDYERRFGSVEGRLRKY